MVGTGASVNELPVTSFVDSMDYSTTDTNNNSISNPSTGLMKSVLDEMLLANDSLVNNNSHSSSSSSSLELLGPFHWSTNPADDPYGGPPSSVNLFDTNPNTWDPGSCVPEDGEVTTLTNILDPLFITFSSEDSKMDQYFSVNSSSEGQGSTVISSDLISSTFLCDRELGVNGGEPDLLTWRPSESDNNNVISCEESLLRSALQAGSSSNNKSHQLSSQIPTTVLAKESELTELRKILLFPPLLNSNNESSVHLSSEQDNVLISEESTLLTLPSDTAYYELKVLDNVFMEPEEVVIPTNVEELIMNRIDHNGNNNLCEDQNKSGMRKEISERKINSTTLSVKWTYTPESNKVRRRKKGVLGEIKKKGMMEPMRVDSLEDVKRPMSPKDVGGNNNNVNVGRKERSLHYCTICSKGFKDKYSVNVHVRTHTGEKPFGCHLCGKNFRQKAHLAKHLQTHVDKDKGNSQKSKSRGSNTSTSGLNNSTTSTSTQS